MVLLLIMMMLMLLLKMTVEVKMIKRCRKSMMMTVVIKTDVLSMMIMIPWVIVADLVLMFMIDNDNGNDKNDDISDDEGGNGDDYDYGCCFVDVVDNDTEVGDGFDSVDNEYG